MTRRFYQSVRCGGEERTTPDADGTVRELTGLGLFDEKILPIRKKNQRAYSVIFENHFFPRRARKARRKRPINSCHSPSSLSCPSWILRALRGKFFSRNRLGHRSGHRSQVEPELARACTRRANPPRLGATSERSPASSLLHPLGCVERLIR